MADHDDTQLACPEMPRWMRKQAARTAAAVATGSAPPGRSDDVAELQARVAALRERVHGVNAGPGTPAQTAAGGGAVDSGWDATTGAVAEAQTAGRDAPGRRKTECAGRSELPGRGRRDGARHRPGVGTVTPRTTEPALREPVAPTPAEETSG